MRQWRELGLRTQQKYQICSTEVQSLLSQQFQTISRPIPNPAPSTLFRIGRIRPSWTVAANGIPWQRARQALPGMGWTIYNTGCRTTPIRWSLTAMKISSTSSVSIPQNAQMVSFTFNPLRAKQPCDVNNRVTYYTMTGWRLTTVRDRMGYRKDHGISF